ncbi:hypothetical protein PIB30_107288, partial [Stylosanthes scabra]|nr:hypothetical protein [Stylosanthes scabra]
RANKCHHYYDTSAKEKWKRLLRSERIKQRHVTLHPWNKKALTSKEGYMQLPRKKAVRAFIEDRGTFREEAGKAARKKSHERSREKAPFEKESSKLPGKKTLTSSKKIVNTFRKIMKRNKQSTRKL